MSRRKVIGLPLVVSLLFVAVWLGTRRWITQQANDGIPKSSTTLAQQASPTLTDKLIWRLMPNSTRVHTVLPVTAGRKWPQNSDGESLSLALVEQTYTLSDPSSIDAEERSASAFWVVEFTENTSITAGRVVGLVHPEFPPYQAHSRDVQFIYHPQLDKFLVITSLSASSTFVSIFEVESDRIHEASPMILPERTADWPSQLSHLAGDGLDTKDGFASEPSADFDPSIIVGAKRYPFGIGGNRAFDFFAYSLRHRQWAIVDFTHVALTSNSDRRGKPPIDPATTWQPVANSEKVISASPHLSGRSLTIVEQEFQRKLDSADDSRLRTKGYWVLDNPPDGAFDKVVSFYFLPPDDSRRIEFAKILKIGLPDQLPYFLAAAEIDGTDLVIRYYSITKSPAGSRPLEFDTILPDWPKRMEPTGELRTKSPVKKLESFFGYVSNGNPIFGVADESSQTYFHHSRHADEWTRLELSKRVQIKK